MNTLDLKTELKTKMPLTDKEVNVVCSVLQKYEIDTKKLNEMVLKFKKNIEKFIYQIINFKILETYFKDNLDIIDPLKNKIKKLSYIIDKDIEKIKKMNKTVNINYSHPSSMKIGEKEISSVLRFRP